MANGIDWFRWHHGTAADPKFGLVAKKADARFGDVLTVWALVLEQASAHLERGTFDPIDPETTDYLLGAEEGTTTRILAAMEARGLIEAGHVARWEKRQPKRERETPDTSTSRVQKLRAKASVQDGVTPVETPCNATSRQETPREDKSREDKELPHTPQAGLARKSSSAISLRTYLEQCKAANAKPIPADDSVFDYADKVGLSKEFLRLQWLEFKDRYGMDGAKRYKAWPSVFGKSVRGNWFKLWYIGNDGYSLSTVGQQAKRQHGDAI